MQGIVLIDKPSGWTSFDVVNYIRRIVAVSEGKKPKHVRVGHTGTLDPLATGLLVVLIGKEYTCRAQELTKVDKTYEVVMKLGQTSTTGDEEGEKQDVSTSRPDETLVRAVLAEFVGDSMQTPPQFSAVKIDGKRAYALAREGKAATLQPRPITIHSIDFEGYDYPFVRFRANVGSGTYIRSLVEDIGSKLQTGAYMTNLRRTIVGTFSIDDALSPQTISADTLAVHLKLLDAPGIDG